MNNTVITSLLNNYSGIATVTTILIAIFTGFWAIWKFRESLKDKRFKTYHELIDNLVNEQQQPDRIMKLDKQIAVVFELRNFPNYYSVTKRILIGIKEDFIIQGVNKRIITEIELTLDFISRCWLSRFIRRIFKI